MSRGGPDLQRLAAAPDLRTLPARSNPRRLSHVSPLGILIRALLLPLAPSALSHIHGRAMLLRAFLLPLALLAGCTSAPKPGVEDVPALPKFDPGVYADINPRWSHDGKRLAFVRATPDRRLQLFVVDAGLERPFALLEAELVSPDRSYSSQARRYASPDTLAWSPDDRQIAFERTEWFTFEDGQRLPGTGLWAFDTHTGRVSPLALHPAHYTNLFYYYHTPEWSPDGNYLAFVAEGVNGQHCIAIRSLKAQNAKEVTPRFDNYGNSDWPAWRPASVASGPAGRDLEGPVLAYRHGIFRSPTIPMTETLRSIRPGSAHAALSGEIWRMRPAQYAMLPSVRSRQPLGAAVDPRISQLVWSPDGRRIAFTLTPDAVDFTRYEIWVLSLADGRATRVSPADGRGYFAPVWIDNRRLGALSPEGDRYAVMVLRLRRRDVRQIGVIDTADCDWSPDRRQIAYARPAAQTPNGPDEPTTLGILETRLRIRGPWRPEAIENGL